jgi:REP element-mobilizing transposase RayT
MNPPGSHPNSSPEGAGQHPGHLPRLPREYYQGDAMVHWTLTIFDRAKGWLTDALHARFRELLLHAAAREGLFCPAYCLMPDHLHLVWAGLCRDTDQRNGMAFLRTHLEPALAPAKFQPQPHDSVLRQAEREHGAFGRFWPIPCARVWWDDRRSGPSAGAWCRVTRSFIRWSRISGRSFGGSTPMHSPPRQQRSSALRFDESVPKTGAALRRRQGNLLTSVPTNTLPKSLTPWA